MSRKAKLTEGFLVVDKPAGVTSHDVVAAVRGNLHTKRVGHAGTLDPFATGVLVVGVGYATKLLHYVTEASKEYVATIRLGLRSSTDDPEGEIAPQTFQQTGAVASFLGGPDGPDGQDGIDAARMRLSQVISEKFLGKIQQVPSSFSAIKVDGKRAYDLARAGVSVELQSREIEIIAFDILDIRKLDLSGGIAVVDVDARIECSAGTYIRAIARDLGEELGTGGHLTSLRRTRVAGFSVDDAVAACVVQKEVFSKKTGETTLRNKVAFTSARTPADVQELDLHERLMSPVDVISNIMPIYPVTTEQMVDISFGRSLDAASLISSYAVSSHKGPCEGKREDAEDTEDAHDGVAVHESQVIAILRPAVQHGREILQPIAVFIPQMKGDMKAEMTVGHTAGQPAQKRGEQS